MQRRGLMAPPDEGDAPQRPGLMAPDPAAAASPLSVKAVLWSVAGILAIVELMLYTLVD